MSSHKIVLVTGATGFLGKVVIEELLRLRETHDIQQVILLIRKKDLLNANACFAQQISSSLCFSLLPKNQGMYDLSSNLFLYQFNIALNPNAAEFVFGHYEEFREFTVIVSQTAQSVKYRLMSLESDFSLFGKRIMGYNMGKTPLEIAKGDATLDSKPSQHKLGMPDLTIIIIYLRPDLIKYKTKFIGISGRSEGMIYKRKRSGIKSYKIKEKSSLDMDLPDIFAVLAAERRTKVAFTRFKQYCSGLLTRFI
ncbi:Fatty acyl-CoA reductase 6, chloroplastic [Fusarium oxysporum f. sp. cubense race 1]|uniref:Fatty acyl-CoA reductase 6, chloroplastic n=1 Tax=Fusarium oxysporum f. sp. cubense (strain race 1) TaxID=1229664 RepID=N4U5M8_FUSC1|nr:Fatty acyl-CoA reductase 6, chloroplastic [Fusarium oxysporum f. sp. cubense race 1]